MSQYWDYDKYIEFVPIGTENVTLSMRDVTGNGLILRYSGKRGDIICLSIMADFLLIVITLLPWIWAYRSACRIIGTTPNL